MKTKICSKCGKEKPITEFYKDKSSKDGLYYWCKECSCKHNKERYRKNKKKIIEYIKKYRRDNPIKVWCKDTIRNHKQKRYKVLFNWEELLSIAKKTKHCPICETKLDWKLGVGLNNNSPTLDRINNDKILTLNNIQIVCWKCNTAKGQMTMKEFIEYCDKVSKKFKNNEQKITELTTIWYRLVGLDHHKDRDCHWYIIERWSYGEPPKYYVEHYGYILDDIYSDEFDIYKEAQEWLIKELTRVINRQKEWAEKVLAEPEKYYTDWRDNITIAKKTLKIIKEVK